MIKLLILDVDGVLTDGKKYYNRDGKVEMKTFCDKDWTAIKRFRALGVNVIFLTGDPFNENIAHHRNIQCIVNRKDGKHTDKGDYVEEICQEYGVTEKEIAFVGDDIFDLGIIKKVKYSYCPEDAPNEIQHEVTEILTAPGGNNCIMVLFDYLKDSNLLPRKYKLEEHMEDVYALDIKEKF
jgi:3-deoxy-D-manno-octulosonate 8-phosphate phosphatase (KDO 8-P phosphatase)